MAISLFSCFDELHKIKDGGGLHKVAADLTEEARSNLPKKDFAVPANKSNTGEKAYPIPDEQHARAALGFAKMHGDAADLERVRAKVKSKYPHMLADAAKEKDSAGPGNFMAGTAALPGMVGGPAGNAGVTAPMGVVGTMGRP